MSIGPVMWPRFQSTLSVRRATPGDGVDVHVAMISIHALRKESDGPLHARPQARRYFNPRSP